MLNQDPVTGRVVCEKCWNRAHHKKGSMDIEPGCRCLCLDGIKAAEVKQARVVLDRRKARNDEKRARENAAKVEMGKRGPNAGD